MKTVEKKAKIVSVRGLGEKTILTLSIIDSSSATSRIPRPEEIIQPLARSDTEKVAMETTRAMIRELKRQGIPTFPMLQRGIAAPKDLSIVLTRKEYEELGKPTVFDQITLKIVV